ncbi:MAG: DUF2528 family protein [Betaproteobacteria bacterium]|nr:DUF2528 family protein [Betaproteobacteria bacterium]
MKKKFKIDNGMEISIVLEIDTDKMTSELAKEVNDFWSYADYVLRASDGCVFQAVARRAAGPLLGFLMDGYSPTEAVMQLSEQEGWPRDEIGITIIDHEIPCFDADMYDVTELDAQEQKP